MPGDERTEFLLVTEAAPYEVGGRRTPAGVHHSLPSAATAFAELAALCGLSYRHCTSVRSLPDDALSEARVLALLTIGNTPWTPRQREIITTRLRDGTLGLLGLHCASDASADWDEYAKILGGRFDGHPVTADLPVAVVRPDHPATEHLAPIWRFHDEMYLFRDVAPDNKILLSIRNGPAAGYLPGEPFEPADTPVAWTRSYGTGRVFYSALGHYGAAWENRDFLLHVFGGLRWLVEA